MLFIVIYDGLMDLVEKHTTNKRVNPPEYEFVSIPLKKEVELLMNQKV